MRALISTDREIPRCGSNGFVEGVFFRSDSSNIETTVPDSDAETYAERPTQPSF